MITSSSDDVGLTRAASRWCTAPPVTRAFFPQVGEGPAKLEHLPAEKGFGVPGRDVGGSRPKEQRLQQPTPGRVQNAPATFHCLDFPAGYGTTFQTCDLPAGSGTWGPNAGNLQVLRGRDSKRRRSFTGTRPASSLVQDWMDACTTCLLLNLHLQLCNSAERHLLDDHMLREMP